MTQSFFLIRQKEEALSFFINLIILDSQKTKLNYTLVTHTLQVLGFFIIKKKWQQFWISLICVHLML